MKLEDLFNGRLINNGRGLIIKRCCASCAYKEIGATTGDRLCMKGQGMVSADDVCEMWKMRNKLTMLPKTNEKGRIKHPDYVKFVTAKIRLANERHLKKPTLDELISEYESENGDRYMDI